LICNKSIVSVSKGVDIDMPPRRIFLIGGAPTAGKSTVARALARSLAIPWISTDQIRRIMRTATTRKENPGLFGPEGYDAQRFLMEFSPEQIVELEYAQAEAVWPGVRRFITADHVWNEGFIVEGVNLLPHLIASDFKSDPAIQSLFLIDRDLARTRQVIFNRGLWHQAASYPDSVKEREVSWVNLFAIRLAEDAIKYRYPIVEVQKREQDLQRTMKAFGLA
jgi:2-phosphoglycerate kinase